MPGGIRPRLDKLTDADLKTLVSDAVAAEKKTKTKDGPKLLTELNKLWVSVLKQKKEYDAMLGEIEKALKAAAGKADIEDSAFDAIQKSIMDSRKKLGPIASDLDKFEKTEAAIKKLYKL